MIARYTHPVMGRIWSDQRRYETWLLVETAAAEAMAAAGIIPSDAARDIRERGAFDVVVRGDLNPMWAAVNKLLTLSTFGSDLHPPARAVGQ